MWEWYFDFLLVKLLLHQLGKRVSQIEIVLAFAEGARNDVDGRLAKRVHFNEGGWFAQYMLMRIKNFLNCSLRLIDIGAVSNRKNHINTTLWIMAVIDDFRAPKLTVWNDDVLIVEGAKIGCEKRDAFNFTKHACAINKVTDFKRTEQKQHHTSRKV